MCVWPLYTNIFPHLSSSPVEIEGVDASVGFTEWANKPSTQDADVRLKSLFLSIFSVKPLYWQLVSQLRAAGAIPIAKTNIPQVCQVKRSSRSSLTDFKDDAFI
jgi:hypothetical protein